MKTMGGRAEFATSWLYYRELPERHSLRVFTSQRPGQNV